MADFRKFCPELEVKINVNRRQNVSVSHMGSNIVLSVPEQDVSIELKNGYIRSLEEGLADGGQSMDDLNSVIKYRQINNIDVIGTKFTNLRGIPSCDILKLRQNLNLISFEGIHKYFASSIRIMNFSNQNIESHILGLLKTNVEGLGYMQSETELMSLSDDFMRAHATLNLYIQAKGDMLECKEHLMIQGLKEYARL